MTEPGRSSQAARRGLIITADDFGLCPEINEAICLLHDRGVVQRTSWLVNSDHFEASAAALRARPALEVAIHLNLTDGRPLLPAAEVPSLVTARGVFAGGRHYDVMVRGLMHRLRAAEVCAEWSAQIARAKGAGVPIASLNGHGYVHLLPSLHDVVAGLIERFAVAHVRLVRRAASVRGVVFGDWSRRLRRTLERKRIPVTWDDRVLGLDASGGLTARRLRALASLNHGGAAELIVHPAIARNAFHDRWAYDGVGELNALLEAKAAAMLDRDDAGRDA